MRYSKKSIVVRCIFIVMGVFLAGFGCACYMKANLGSDPVTAFIQGLGKVLHVSPGMATNVLNVSAFLILLVVGRRLIHIGTILYTLLLGIFVDASSALLTAVLGNAPGMPSRIIVLVLGTAAIGFGLGLYQAAELGIGPTDGINQTIVRVTGLPYRVERILFDAVMAAAGWLLGGTVFIGTIVGIVAVGPIMAPTITWGKKLLHEENPQRTTRGEH